MEVFRLVVRLEEIGFYYALIKEIVVLAYNAAAGN